MKNYSLGLIPDKQDNRDLLMSYYLQEATLPTKYDCSKFMGPIRDQGREGTCVGFASAAMKGYQEYKESQNFIEMSPRYNYEKSRQLNSIRGEGTTLRDSMKSLQKDGICPECLRPYKEYEAGIETTKQNHSAKRFIIKTYAKLTTLDETIKSIYSNGPGCLGMSITKEWYKVGSDGLIKMPKSGAKELGGHAICYCGYDLINKLLRIRNSWGNLWGDGVYAWLPFSLVDKSMVCAWSSVDAKTISLA